MLYPAELRAQVLNIKAVLLMCHGMYFFYDNLNDNQIMLYNPTTTSNSNSRHRYGQGPLQPLSDIPTAQG